MLKPDADGNGDFGKAVIGSSRTPLDPVSVFRQSPSGLPYL